MKRTQTKEQYAPPRCEELEMALEGVIALSGDTYAVAVWETEEWEES